MRNLLFSLLFSIPIYLILFVSIGDHVVCGRCPEDQRSLLLELKNNLVFNSSLSKKLVTWNEDVDYCDWIGVGCYHGCVIDLDLSNEWISGGIDNSSSLFSLGFIQNLNLAYNSFDSMIPSGFERFSNLSVLNMSNAGFGGQIPVGISRLTRLVTLDLSSSSVLRISTLKLENPNLKTMVQNLSNLRELFLDGVDLSAGSNEWCTTLSSSLPNLRVLSLSSCSLSGPIDSSLAEMKFLSVIRLNNNNFSSAVPREFAEFSNLTALHLSNSRLIGLFPEWIFQVSTLQTLDLSNNMLLKGFIPNFQSNGSLQILVLHDTKFSGILQDSIGNYGNLTRLDFANCEFGGLIPNSITKLRYLSYMDFSNNRFVGTIPSFSLLKKLNVLNLAHNLLNGLIHTTRWEVLSDLVNLDLRNNSLTGSIPVSLFKLPSIQKLQLCFNQFSGSLNELRNPSAFLLDTLALESNQLEGLFPSSFFELRGLKILSLSFNNFAGTLDLNKLTQLKNLSTLELSNNNLSVVADTAEWNSASSPFPQLSTLKLVSCKLRKIPGFLKNQSKLNYLDISSNELEGDTPPWIWEIGSLRELNLSFNSLVGLGVSSHDFPSNLYLLDLHANKFQGPITTFPPSAAYLDFSNNSFSSALPSDIGKFLSFTVFFSLSRNHIHGIIPESICDTKALQVLDLSNNSFGGSFPRCLTDMTKHLVVLNLRGNHLNGSIPNTFPITCGLRTLDLSRNKIAGKLPQSLSNCRALEVLDLGYNRINDIFPCTLNNIPTLRVLVLRSNKLNGTLRCPVNEQGTWPSLQSIDLALNNISGIISGQILTKWKAMANEKELYGTSNVYFLFVELGSVNYQDTVMVTNKGLKMEVTKILTVLTTIDLSYNQFQGSIPSEIEELKALHALNLSHTSLSGEIPSSIGNMMELFSLDLSRNFLTGTIPSELANLAFLIALDLSYNKLEGEIPRGAQIETFPLKSFYGNDGLCGPPLKGCDVTFDWQERDSETESEFEWEFIFIFIGAGFLSGVITGAIVGLEIWKRKSIALIGFFFIIFNRGKKIKPSNKRIYARRRR